MVCGTRQLDGFGIAARDGDIGHVREVYFDDQRWTIRHLVVDTGGWLSGRQVLISPHAITRLDPAGRRVEASLTRREIEAAPGLDTNLPVSRQQEYYDHFGYPYYWAGAGLWGAAEYPLPYGGLGVPAAAPSEMAQHAQARREAADPHLRSSAAVTGYRVQASDGSIGHIEDFLFDERSWQIRHIVVDTTNWLPGGHVLVDPHSIDAVDWDRREVRVQLTREQIKSSPPYHPAPRVRGEDLGATEPTIRTR